MSLNINKLNITNLQTILNEYYPLKEVTIKSDKYLNFQQRCFIQYTACNVRITKSKFNKSLLLKNEDKLFEVLHQFENFTTQYNTTMFNEGNEPSLFINMDTKTRIEDNDGNVIRLDDDINHIEEVVIIFELKPYRKNRKCQINRQVCKMRILGETSVQDNTSIPDFDL